MKTLDANDDVAKIDSSIDITKSVCDVLGSCIIIYFLKHIIEGIVF
jgi:hypothetical protein